MTYFILILSFGYAFVLLCVTMPGLRYAPVRSVARSKPHDFNDSISFSVIVVYRNEEDSLPNLLQSILEIKYPYHLVEWIFVNDGSSDHSLELLTEFSDSNADINIKLLDRLKESASAKKDGITRAVDQALHEYILCTDADCILPPTWLDYYESHYQDYPESLLVAGPIALTGKGFIASIQKIEMIALQAVTIGSFGLRRPFMCSGANMSFTKSAFYEVDGYDGNSHISSGDDVFLLEKLAAENAYECHFLKSEKVMVRTAAKKTFKEMVVQRARWARKGSHTKSLLNKLIGFQVIAMNLLLLCSPLLFLAELISKDLLVLIFLLKFFTDFVVLLIGSQLIHENWAKYYGLHFLIYPFLTLWIAIQSFGEIRWSGRVIDR